MAYSKNDLQEHHISNYILQTTEQYFSKYALHNKWKNWQKKNHNPKKNCFLYRIFSLLAKTIWYHHSIVSRNQLLVNIEHEAQNAEDCIGEKAQVRWTLFQWLTTSQLHFLEFLIALNSLNWSWESRRRQFHRFTLIIFFSNLSQNATT